MDNSLPSFPYTAMLITGIMHCILGVVIFICSCIGLGRDKYGGTYNYYYTSVGYIYNSNINGYIGGCIVSALWIIMVGILGILAGIKRERHQTTHGLKIAYMVTAILSAVIFSWVGLSLSVLIRLFVDYQAIGIVGSLCSFAAFVLAIISSSICCCCAKSSQETSAGHVFVQNQGPTGNYPLGTYPPGTNTPGTYPPGTYSTGNYPPGTYPAGSYPPSSYPAAGDPGKN